jgi:hypothetical protein
MGVGRMDKKDELEIARNILNNAVSMHLSKELILKISQKVDKYIVEYYRKEEWLWQNKKK